MFKKVLSLALVAAISAGIAIGATIAYFTDTEEAVNVMTTGSVFIEQNEEQRIEKDGEFSDKLEPFEQGKVLMPVTYPGDRSADTVTIGDYTIELKDIEANYVDKIVTVKNTGKSDAYVRTLVAIPTGGEDWEPKPVAANDCWLHWNYPADTTQHWTLNSTATFIEVDGIGYYVWEFVHKEALEPGKTTYPVIRGFYMDKKVNNDNKGFFMEYDNGTVKRIDDIKLGDEVNVLVLSQAGQVSGFEKDGADAALDKMFGDVTVANATEWFNEIYANKPEVVEVTAEDWASIDFTKNNATFKLSGNFTDDLTVNVNNGLNQTYDASGATFEADTTVTINAPGVAHAYSSLDAERSGNVTISGFKVETLNVLAYNNEKVTIQNNKVNAMSVIGGNFELVIDSNIVDGEFSQYSDGENQTNEYGISLRITDYELSVTNNTIVDTYSHSIGINGRQGEVASDWGSCGADNKIEAFSGNKITVNSTKTARAALKIWCDQVYAPYATSGQKPTAAAEALMADIKADTTNVFGVHTGHFIFNIFDYTAN